MMKKLAVLLVTAVLLFSMIACTPEQKTAEEMAQIWSAANTEKILADREYAEDQKSEGKLLYETAKGEYEVAQLIVTAKSKISDIELVAAELMGPNGAKIGTDNIDVYYQKYMQIDAMSSPKAPADFGLWPDALVPMDAIVKADENSVESGMNQGFTVKILTPTDAQTGIYSGNFTLKMDGAEVKIPVSVEVWDFVIPQETHMKTAFYNFRKYLMGGELDNSEAMYQEYFDFMLDYRISVTDLPVYDNDIENYIEQVKKYAADPRCGAYNMRFQYENKTVVMEGVINKFIPEINYEAFKQTLKRMAEESTEELNLFDKLYIYDNAVDEPEGTDRIEDANYKQIMINRSLQETVDELNEAGFDFAAHGITEEDILGIEFVITGRYINEMPDIRTYCPLVSDMTTEEQRQLYEDIRNSDPDGYKTTWWYDAWQPQYPYPNYRIDESSVGSRVMSWMQKDYGITGLLYWGTSVYSEATTPNADPGPRDPYENPYSFGGAKVTQDGCLTYPGRPYGIYGPVPSIRLESIRDGIEDYEYLWLLEQLVNEAAEKYSGDFSFDSIMSTIYDSLYTGVIPSTDGTKVLNARREVAEMIELLQSSANAVVLVNDVDAIENSVDIEIYVAEGTQVKIDGTLQENGTVSNNGTKFAYTKSLTETNNYVQIEITNGTYSETLTKYVGKKSNAVSMFDESGVLFSKSDGHSLDPKEHIVLEKNTDSIEGYGTDAMKITIAKYESDNEIAQTIYMPEIWITKDKAFASVNAENFDSLYFDIYNAAETDKVLKVFLCTSTAEKQFVEVTLKPGHNKVSVSQIYLDGWTHLKEVNRISLVFEKCKSDTPDVYYMKNMYYTLAG